MCNINMHEWKASRKVDVCILDMNEQWAAGHAIISCVLNNPVLSRSMKWLIVSLITINGPSSKFRYISTSAGNEFSLNLPVNFIKLRSSSLPTVLGTPREADKQRANVRLLQLEVDSETSITVHSLPLQS